MTGRPRRRRRGGRLLGLRRVVVALGLAVSAVSGLADPALLDFTADERLRILQHGPWPPPPARDPGNALAGRPDAIALGQQLFFEPRLSPDGRFACASCHVPGLAFTDGRARARGRDTGAGDALDRNTPTLWDAGQQRWYGWDGAFDSLWSQAIHPLLDGREMASTPAHLQALLRSDAALGCQWRRVHGAPPPDAAEATLVLAAKALGAFVASLQSGPTPFDRFRDALARGDSRTAAQYPADAQRGLRLFVGRGRCSSCHLGPLFSNGEFGDIGAPFFVRPGVVDPGRHGGIRRLRGNRYNLLGPFSDAPDDEIARKTRHVELQHRNFGEFKVPGLRNLEHTAPYLHDGQLPTLEAVIDHYSSLSPDRLHADGEQILRPLHLNAGEKADLAAFLRSLSSPASTSWQAPPTPPCGGATPSPAMR